MTTPGSLMAGLLPETYHPPDPPGSHPFAIRVVRGAEAEVTLNGIAETIARIGGVGPPGQSDWVVQRDGPITRQGRPPFLGFGAEAPVLLDNWRRGLVATAILDITADLRGVDRCDLAIRLAAAITAHLDACLDTPSLRTLATRRLRGEPLTSAELTMWEAWLWQRVYTWPPYGIEDARWMEQAVLEYIRTMGQ